MTLPHQELWMQHWPGGISFGHGLYLDLKIPVLSRSRLDLQKLQLWQWTKWMAQLKIVVQIVALPKNLTSALDFNLHKKKKKMGKSDGSCFIVGEGKKAEQFPTTGMSWWPCILSCITSWAVTSSLTSISC